MKFYIKTNKKLNIKKFKNDFEILSVLRNLKIIGIFTSVCCIRDGKKKYLKLIPYTWKLIKYRIKENNEYLRFEIAIKKLFSKKIR